MSEPNVIVIDFEDGQKPLQFTSNRIRRQAFTRNEVIDGQMLVFEGFMCEGEFPNKHKETLNDYGWKLFSTVLKGQELWANFNDEAVKFTAEVLDIPIEYPNASLLFVLKE